MGNDSKSKLPSSTPGQLETGDNSDLPNKDDDLVEGKEPAPPPPLLSSSSTTSTSAPSKPNKAEENQSLPGPSKSILARFKHRPNCPVAQTGLCSCFRELVSSAKATTTEGKVEVKRGGKQVFLCVNSFESKEFLFQKQGHHRHHQKSLLVVRRRAVVRRRHKEASEPSTKRGHQHRRSGTNRTRRPSPRRTDFPPRCPHIIESRIEALLLLSHQLQWPVRTPPREVGEDHRKCLPPWW